MTRVSLLLLTALLVSCGGGGGGGDSPSAGTPPGNDGGGTPPGNDGGTTPPGNDGGGTPPGPSTGAHYEESDAAAVSLSAGWTPSDPRVGWSGGAAMQSVTAGAMASFTFTGTSVRWIGSRSRDGGIALVRVDGGEPKEVDLFSRPKEYRTPIITIYDLAPGQHTLTIELTNRKNSDASGVNLVVVDAFDVDPPIVSHLQETDENVKLTGTWVHVDDDVYSGGGVKTPDEPANGGVRVAESAGAKATLKFRGTSVKWIGYRGRDCGIARVQLASLEPDGEVKEIIEVKDIDTYSRNVKYQEVLYTATGLADANYQLTIEVTGRKDDASTAAKIFVDAFDVTTPGRRYQESDRAGRSPRPKIGYSGVWSHGHNGRVWSEGTASTSNNAGSIAIFTFTGTSVRWIGCQKLSCGGVARVYIDGTFVKEVRNRRSLPIENFQHEVFRQDGLTRGLHTLMIEVITTGPYVVVDAFDVEP